MKYYNNSIVVCKYSIDKKLFYHTMSLINTRSSSQYIIFHIIVWVGYNELFAHNSKRLVIQGI